MVDALPPKSPVLPTFPHEIHRRMPVPAPTHAGSTLPQVVEAAVGAAVDAYLRGESPKLVVDLSNRGETIDLGIKRTWRGFREVDPSALAATMPLHAQHLAAAFVQEAKSYDIDPLLLVAISRHETASWTSAAFKRGNAMGVATRKGPRSFKNPVDTIRLMAKTLSDPDGYYKDANTIEDLWKIYAPSKKVGTRANNDPRRLNDSWGPSVARNIQRYEEALKRQLVVNI
jgi:hypothetical protein